MIEEITAELLKEVYKPAKDSHKGENGRLLVIGGSELFHAASMWALEVASRMVDLVFYASVPVNREIVRKQKKRFRDGIVVPEGEIEQYLTEADCVLIGPGMMRKKILHQSGSLRVARKGAVDWQKWDTEEITNYSLRKYPKKRWVLDAGALQMVEPELLTEQMIITPHWGEFKRLVQGEKCKVKSFNSKYKIDQIDSVAKRAKLIQEFSERSGGVIVVLKGRVDLVCQGDKCLRNETGNEGMTKGGTGDVLAGLIAGFYCKNEAFLAAAAGTYINGLAGDRLYKRVGPYFNASDLCDEVPKVMAELLGYKKR